jgi:hypothetical protein
MAEGGNNKWTFPDPDPASDLAASTAFSKATVDFLNGPAALTKALVQEGSEVDPARESIIRRFSSRFSCAVRTFLF